MFLQSNKPLSHDNDDVDEKFGDLSHLWGDQFTHPCPLGTSFTQSRVWDKDGPGEIYCPDICPYNSCPAVQYFPYNTSTMASELPYNASAARLCALCPPRTTLPAAYLPILIESDEGQIEKALNTRMFRCCL